MVVIWCDVGGEWFECVEWCFFVLVELEIYVFFD